MEFEVFNPDGKPVSELPVIWGFNNGGPPDWLSGQLLADDGEFLGGHICSNEAFMPSDLGCEKGTRPDRHETFRAHFPGGYRMEFVGGKDVAAHKGIKDAYALHVAKYRPTTGEK